MKKVKVISEAGIIKFEEVLSQWFADNSATSIISTSFSTQSDVIPTGASQTMHVFTLSALIVYEEFESTKAY
jgi:hypothetical protein